MGLDLGAVAVNPATDTIYVANEGVTPDNTVSVIDGKTNMIKTEIPIGTSPLPADSANVLTSTVYVGDAGNDTVLVIDGKTNTVTATIAAGSGLDAVATNSVTGRTYVANGDDNTVSVIKG